MEGPRACKMEEFETLLELINKTFRAQSGYKPTMAEEFPLLLNKENINNIRTILIEDKPVAAVNFYKSTILIEGIPISAASVGGVCTDVDNQGKGYSTILLDDAEQLMREYIVDIVLVSGDRSLYLRRGCCKAGSCFEFVINPDKEKSQEIELVDFKDEYLRIMAEIYNREPTRYYRSLYEFKMLLKGATIPWGNYTYKVYLLKSRGLVHGYVVLRIIDDDPDWGYLIEFSGDREIVYRALTDIALQNSLNYIKVKCTSNDSMSYIIKREKIKYDEINLYGTMKILNFVSFMNKLMPYFRQYVDREIADNIIFGEEGGRYMFELGDEVLKICDDDTLVKLVFGDKSGKTLYPCNKPMIDSFISSVFPIPFVWAGNLNFQ